MDADAREESRQHDVQSGGRRSVAGLKVVRYDANMCPQVPYVPLLSPQYSNPRIVPVNRVELSRDYLQQRRLSRAIRSENHGWFALLDTKCQILKYSRITTIDRSVTDIY